MGARHEPEGRQNLDTRLGRVALDNARLRAHPHGPVPAAHPAAQPGRLDGRLLRARRERLERRDPTRRGARRPQLRPRRPARPRSAEPLGEEHQPRARRRRAGPRGRTGAAGDRDRAGVRAGCGGGGAGPAGGARDRSGDPPAARRGRAERAPRGGLVRHGGEPVGRPHVEARLRRALAARCRLAARSAGAQGRSALSRARCAGRAGRGDRAGGVPADRRPVQARCRSDLLRHDRRLVRRRRGGRWGGRRAGAAAARSRQGRPRGGAAGGDRPGGHP